MCIRCFPCRGGTGHAQVDLAGDVVNDDGFLGPEALRPSGPCGDLASPRPCFFNAHSPVGVAVTATGAQRLFDHGVAPDRVAPVGVLVGLLWLAGGEGQHTAGSCEAWVGEPGGVAGGEADPVLFGVHAVESLDEFGVRNEPVVGRPESLVDPLSVIVEACGHLGVPGVVEDGEGALRVGLVADPDIAVRSCCGVRLAMRAAAGSSCEIGERIVGAGARRS